MPDEVESPPTLAGEFDDGVEQSFAQCPSLPHLKQEELVLTP